MSEWVGYAINVKCGEPLGCYQGTIVAADGNTITLTKAFRNGFPYPKSQVTLNASDIKELRIIESRAEPSEQRHSTVAVANKNKKGPRATVCENLQANNTNPGNQVASVNNNKGSLLKCPTAGPARSKPIEIQNNKNKVNNNNAVSSGSYGNAGSTPKDRRGNNYDKARRRNEACFGDGADTPLEDFDFEGNLALFDKRALWEQMRHSKPDLVRHADDCKYRHDEHILPRAAALPPAYGPLEPGAARYHTDDGSELPAVSAAVRRRMWAGLAARGLAPAADALLARAAADVALRLAGGARRLHPANAHQAPAAAALLGAHGGGARGALAARLLASHGVRVTALVAGGGGGGGGGAALRRELAALLEDGGRVVDSVAALPSADVVLLALCDTEREESEEQYAEALGWARAARGAGVWLDAGAGWGAAGARAAVQGGLAGAAPGPGGGAGAPQLYLADVAVPRGLLQELGLQVHRSPFGASSVLALHPA